MSIGEDQQAPAAAADGETARVTDASKSDASSASASLPLRRSTRHRAAKAAQPAADPAPPRGARKTSAAKATMDEPRRNPKRKASEPPKRLDGLPSDLLEEALKPLTQAEIEEWEGWIELESEPAFFNIILRDLGVRNVKAQELFTLDQGSIDFLPKPVFGLIFLFEYQAGLDEPMEEEQLGNVWFANQTTQNACATVALLNIIMNAPQVQLGDQLEQFKESTKNLDTAPRGYSLSSNMFIRRIHNSLIRRMDQLNADLALENAASQPRQKKSKTASKKRRKKKDEDDSENAFHFVAYVPADGQVWELDGLQRKPHKIGPIDSDDWTTVARPQIEARMLQYEDSQLSFNLLALCQSPLAVHSRKIAGNLASLKALLRSIRSRPEFATFEPSDKWLDETNLPSYLSEFQLTATDVENAPVPQTLHEKTLQPGTEAEANELYETIVVDTKAVMGEYRAELISMAEDEQRVKGRKKDFGPALHKWVTKLAQKGVLEDMISSG